MMANSPDNVLSGMPNMNGNGGNQHGCKEDKFMHTCLYCNESYEDLNAVESHLTNGHYIGASVKCKMYKSTKISARMESKSCPTIKGVDVQGISENSSLSNMKARDQCEVQNQISEIKTSKNLKGIEFAAKTSLHNSAMKQNKRHGEILSKKAENVKEAPLQIRNENVSLEVNKLYSKDNSDVGNLCVEKTSKLVITNNQEIAEEKSNATLISKNNSLSKMEAREEGEVSNKRPKIGNNGIELRTKISKITTALRKSKNLAEIMSKRAEEVKKVSLQARNENVSLELNNVYSKENSNAGHLKAGSKMSEQIIGASNQESTEKKGITEPVDGKTQAKSNKCQILHNSGIKDTNKIKTAKDAAMKGKKRDLKEQTSNKLKMRNPITPVRESPGLKRKQSITNEFQSSEVIKGKCSKVTKGKNEKPNITHEVINGMGESKKSANTDKKVIKGMGGKKKSIVAHTNRAHGAKKDFSCMYCGFTTSEDKSLKQHVKDLHKNKAAKKATKSANNGNSATNGNSSNLMVNTNSIAQAVGNIPTTSTANVGGHNQALAIPESTERSTVTAMSLTVAGRSDQGSSIPESPGGNLSSEQCMSIMADYSTRAMEMMATHSKCIENMHLQNLSTLKELAQSNRREGSNEGQLNVR